MRKNKVQRLVFFKRTGEIENTISVNFTYDKDAMVTKVSSKVNNREAVETDIAIIEGSIAFDFPFISNDGDFGNAYVKVTNVYGDGSERIEYVAKRITTVQNSYNTDGTKRMSVNFENESYKTYHYGNNAINFIQDYIPEAYGIILNGCEFYGVTAPEKIEIDKSFSIGKSMNLRVYYNNTCRELIKLDHNKNVLFRRVRLNGCGNEVEIAPDMSIYERINSSVKIINSDSLLNFEDFETIENNVLGKYLNYCVSNNNYSCVESYLNTNGELVRKLERYQLATMDSYVTKETFYRVE